MIWVWTIFLIKLAFAIFPSNCTIILCCFFKLCYSLLIYIQVLENFWFDFYILKGCDRDINDRGKVPKADGLFSFKFLYGLFLHTMKFLGRHISLLCSLFF